MASMTSTYTQTTLKNLPTTLEPNRFLVKGRQFLGWSTEQNAERPTYSDQQEVAFDSNITLYAVWQNVS